MKRKVIALITVTVLVVCTSIGSVSAGWWVTTTQNVGGGSNLIAGLAWTTYYNSLQYHRATIKTSSTSQSSGEAKAGLEAYAELWARIGYSRSAAIYYS